MSNLLELLRDCLGEAEITPELRELYRQSEPYFDELCRALGDRRADEIWMFAVGLGAVEEQASFSSGFRLGARLMLEVLLPEQKTARSSR